MSKLGSHFARLFLFLTHKYYLFRLIDGFQLPPEIIAVATTSKVEVQYDGSKLIGISKVDDEKELSQPPFSLMHFGVQTFSGKFRPEDPVTIIKVRYKDEDTSFQNNEEKCI
jgi:hypothetical protein